MAEAGRGFAWLGAVSPALSSVGDVASIARQIEAGRGEMNRPFCVAIDGRSGVGKSTLARQLAGALAGTLLDGDGFFAGGPQLRDDSPEARAHACIDWRRQRPVLEALLAGRAARYCAFDWQAFDGRLETEPTLVEPSASGLVIIEGVYSARPELADLLDVRLLLRVPDDVRLARLMAREHGLTAWERQWHEAEDWYFAHAAPPAGFDVIIEG